jgi:hypothetical protein
MSWKYTSSRGRALMLVLILIALSVGVAYLTGFRLSFFPSQSVAFNGSTSLQTVTYTGFCQKTSGSYNFPGYSFCPSGQPTPSTSSTMLGSAQSTFSLPIANLAGTGGSCASGLVWSQCAAAASVLSSNTQTLSVGGSSQYPPCQAPPGQSQPVTPCIDSNGNLAYGCPIGPGLPPCPASSLPPPPLSSVTGSGYTLNGQILGGAFKLIGSDSTYCLISGEACSQPSSWSYNLANQTLTAYRFGFIMQISVSGDHIVAKTSCQVAVSFYADQCTTQQVNSLNQVLNVVNSYDLAKGQVMLNISVPTSYVASNLTRYGIIDGWLGQNGQCTIPSASSGPSCGNSGTGGCIVSLPYGGQAAITPCQGHAIIPNSLSGYSISSFPLAGTQFQINQNQLSQLNPNVQYTFTITGLGPQYKALCGTSNCSASSVQDCLTAGGGTTAVGGNINANACFIQADYGITVQIPILFDVLGVAPCGKCIISGSTTTVTTTTSGGGITVHVQDGILGLPVTSAQVGFASTSGGGGCSSAQQSTGTDPNGNVAFYGLPAGSYVVCASAGSGTVTLLFFVIGIVYQQQQANVGVSSGVNTPVTIVLQPSLGSAFTLIGTVAFFVILILAAVVLIILVGYRGRSTGQFVSGVRKQ